MHACVRAESCLTQVVRGQGNSGGRARVSPSAAAPVPGLGVAAAGEEATGGGADASIGAAPVWGEAREGGPGEAPPMLF